MPVVLKEIIDKLSATDRARLNYAFEHDLAQHTILADGVHYIGVNTKTITHLKPLIERGKWSYGELTSR